jgi:hypothetical protein
MTWAANDPRRSARANALRLAADHGEPQTNGILAADVVEAGGIIDVVVTLIFDAATGDESRILPSDVQIAGGVRRPSIAVTHIVESGRKLRLRVERRGDFSRYTLAFRRDGAAIPGYDALLSSIPLGFRLDCAQDFDCHAAPVVAAEELPKAPIDYQARDYEGFRTLLLDRFKSLVTDWVDPGPASPEVTLVEMLAHVADRLSYAQDAVATEAYLDTARLRVSAKRHARLVDYRMSDGANARCFVHVRMHTPTGGAGPARATVNRGCRFLTRWPGVSAASAEMPATAEARVSGAQIFEAVARASLTSAHNRIIIHDFLGGLSELPAGTTSITVADPGRKLALAVKDFLLIEEVLDPETGDASPDPARRHVVRLTGVAPAVDPIGMLDGAGVPRPLETLVLTWGSADALPSVLPLASVTSGDAVDGIPAQSANQPSLIARGNMVLADHGESRGLDVFSPIRQPGRRRVFMPLSAGPVSMAHRFDDGGSITSAAAALYPRSTASPAIAVRQAVQAGADPVWEVRDDLFDSENTDQHLVLDVEHGGVATLRSGDGLSGRLPGSGQMTARYRIGNGIAGNVGAEAIGHLLTDAYVGIDGSLVQAFAGQAGDVVLVRNPLAALGGIAPETIAEVRVRAPIGFQEQRRAVTPADYVTFLKRDPTVANAKAVEHWTGSWRAIVLLVDLIGGGGIDDETETRFRHLLEPVRLAGHVLEFRSPTLVPVEIAMTVCVKPEARTDTVLQRLTALFSSARLADGMVGLFHPDRFTFGEALPLSELYAAAQSVDGVRHVDITTLKRQGVTGSSTSILDGGALDFGPYEIPILANDPNFPDRGVVTFTMEGGR